VLFVIFFTFFTFFPIFTYMTEQMSCQFIIVLPKIALLHQAFSSPETTPQNKATAKTSLPEYAFGYPVGNHHDTSL